MLDIMGYAVGNAYKAVGIVCFEAVVDRAVPCAEIGFDGGKVLFLPHKDIKSRAVMHESILLVQLVAADDLLIHRCPPPFPPPQPHLPLWRRPGLSY